MRNLHLRTFRYVDYLLEALKRRELFQWLTLAPAGFLHTLLFRDRFNFMGVAARLPERLLEVLSLRPGALTQARPLSCTCFLQHTHMLPFILR